MVWVLTYSAPVYSCVHRGHGPSVLREHGVPGIHRTWYSHNGVFLWFWCSQGVVLTEGHGTSVILVFTGHGTPVYQLLALSNHCAVAALPGHGAVSVSMSAHPHFVSGLWATLASAQECFTPGSAL